MKWAYTAAILLLFLVPLRAAEEVRYFPSILYGHILDGPGASRYETIFVVSARRGVRGSLRLFSENGMPMKAKFVDQKGVEAESADHFEFFVHRDKSVRIRLQLEQEEAGHPVAVKTGWAVFRFPSEVEVTAIVRVTTPDGKFVMHHVLLPERADPV